jgi:hypothetical protein
MERILSPKRLVLYCPHEKAVFEEEMICYKTTDDRRYDEPAGASGEDPGCGFVAREMIGSAAQRLMELEVEGLTGATYGEKSQDRLVQRNGYRDRIWETRAGSVELRIPKRSRPIRLPHTRVGALDDSTVTFRYKQRKSSRWPLVDLPHRWPRVYSALSPESSSQGLATELGLPHPAKHQYAAQARVLLELERTASKS